MPPFFDPLMCWVSMLLDHTREKFAVGATTFVLQIPARTFGSAILTRTAKPRPALQLSEIAFSVYYPTYSDLSTRKYRYLDWVIRYSGKPRSPATHGYFWTKRLNSVDQFEARLPAWLTSRVGADTTSKLDIESNFQPHPLSFQVSQRWYCGRYSTSTLLSSRYLASDRWLADSPMLT